MAAELPSLVASAVLGGRFEFVTKDTPSVVGFDFNVRRRRPLLGTYLTTGFQATNLGLAIDEINRMRAWRLSDPSCATSRRSGATRRCGGARARRST